MLSEGISLISKQCSRVRATCACKFTLKDLIILIPPPLKKKSTLRINHQFNHINKLIPPVSNFKFYIYNYPPSPGPRE